MFAVMQRVARVSQRQLILVLFVLEILIHEKIRNQQFVLASPLQIPDDLFALSAAIYARADFMNFIFF